MGTGRITKVLPKKSKISPMVEENLKNYSQMSRKTMGGGLRNLLSSHTAQFQLQSVSANNRYNSSSIPASQQSLSDIEILNAPPIAFNASYGDVNELNLEDSYKFLDELENGTSDLSIPETQYMQVDNTENAHSIHNNKNIESDLYDIAEKLKKEFDKINGADEKERKINLVGEFYRKYNKNYNPIRLAKLLGKDRHYILNMRYMYEHSKNLTPNKFNINSLLKHSENNASFFKIKNRNSYSKETKNAVMEYLKFAKENFPIGIYNLYAFIEFHTKIPSKTIKYWHAQQKIPS